MAEQEKEEQKAAEVKEEEAGAGETIEDEDTEKNGEGVTEEAEDIPETEDNPETDPDTDSRKGRPEKKTSRKQTKPDKKADVYKDQIAQLEDRVKRQLAEFENFRRRTEKEKASMYEIGAKSVIEKILPVVDNFERGLAMVPEENREEPFVDGMNKIYRQLMAELTNLGVKPIEAVGQEFNPELHNAVMQVENEELESGTVAQELQKGYLYKDTVVRHSMVAVVQ